MRVLRRSAAQLVLQPLTLAVLLVAAAWLAAGRYLQLGEPPAGDWLAGTLLRALRDPFCQAMLGVFSVLVLYALLQLLGAAIGRHTASGRYANAVLAFIAGRSAAPNGPNPSDAGMAEQDVADVLAPLQFGIWVLPLLGFIGTVVGISAAIGGLEEMLARAGGQSPEGVRQVMSGLRFAFDTTFVGLTLVIPLMLLLVWLRTVTARQAGGGEP